MSPVYLPAFLKVITYLLSDMFTYNSSSWSIWTAMFRMMNSNISSTKLDITFTGNALKVFSRKMFCFSVNDFVNLSDIPSKGSYENKIIVIAMRWIYAQLSLYWQEHRFDQEMLRDIFHAIWLTNKSVRKSFF